MPWLIFVIVWPCLCNSGQSYSLQYQMRYEEWIRAIFIGISNHWCHPIFEENSLYQVSRMNDDSISGHWVSFQPQLTLEMFSYNEVYKMHYNSCDTKYESRTASDVHARLLFLINTIHTVNYAHCLIKYIFPTICIILVSVFEKKWLPMSILIIHMCSEFWHYDSINVMRHWDLR